MPDDPMLTVRLDESDRKGNKRPHRVVLDASGMLAPDSQLVRTAREVPVLIVTETEDTEKCRQWEQNGCEVLHLPRPENEVRFFLRLLLEHFASRRWTHVLVEGGRQVFGAFFDAGYMDEVHTFIAPKLIGGESAISVIGGEGLEKMSLAVQLESPEIMVIGQDIYVRGRTTY